MKKSLLVWLMVLCAVALTGCKDDKDPPRRESSVSGPATLRVENRMQLVQEVSFDGSYIGDVAPNSTRDWRVPEGRHVVTAYDRETGAASGTFEFRAGRVTTVTVGTQAPRYAGLIVEEDKTIEVRYE